MINGEGIVCISSIDWDAKWQGHQEIATALTKSGNDVLFIENTGVRAPAVRDMPRLKRRFAHWRRPLPSGHQRLQIYSPLVLPLPYSRLAQGINHAILARVCRRWSKRVGHPHPIVLTFLPTPLVCGLIRAIRPSLTVYYCVDHLALSSPGAARIQKTEDRLLRDADLVFVTSESLRERAARVRGRVHLFPAGVDIGAFDRAREAPVDLPADVGGLPRPVVGYVGGLNQKFDLELLAGVAQRMPDVQFVLVGPVQTDVSCLSVCPNVILAGHRPHGEIPAYLKAMDVAIIPYRVTEYTSGVYPAKLNEYLAMGLPVVGTPLAELQRFNAQHGDLLALEGSVDGFRTAILRALTMRSAEEAARRVAVARGNRWELRIEAMTTLMTEVLAQRRSGVLHDEDAMAPALREPFQPLPGSSRTPSPDGIWP